MKHLTGWRVGAAALGTMALAAGAFGLPAVLSSDVADPAPIEITTISGAGNPIDDGFDADDDADALVPQISTAGAEVSAPEQTTSSAVSVTSLVSAASNASPISISSPADASDAGASTASTSSTNPAPAPTVDASVDSASSPDSPSSVDSPSSIDS